MPQNFIECGREQAFLMPPSLLEWVPEDHLVWTILEAVEEMELSAFYADYRWDGHGRPAYDPKLMVALLLYAYARGNRSSRGIEHACAEDVAYRVICSNLGLDQELASSRRPPRVGVPLHSFAEYGAPEELRRGRIGDVQHHRPGVPVGDVGDLLVHVDRVDEVGSRSLP